MFHYTVFGATSGEIAPTGFSALTVFGAAELRRPTLARRILHLRNKPTDTSRSWIQRIRDDDRGLLITVFGATEIHRPTLMEEYSALRSLIAASDLSPEACRQLLEQLLSGEKQDDWATFTLFGACSTVEAKPARETKALDAAERAGMITHDHRRRLDDLIGAAEPTVIDALGRLALGVA